MQQRLLALQPAELLWVRPAEKLPVVLAVLTHAAPLVLAVQVLAYAVPLAALAPV